MKRQLLLALGVTLLLAGWVSAFLVNTLSNYRTFYILAPTLLLGTGMGLVRRTVNVKVLIVTIALTALMGLATLNTIFPARGVSISAFQQRMKNHGLEWRSIPVRTAKGEELSAFPLKTLEAVTALNISLYTTLPEQVAALTSDDRGYIYASLADLGVIYRLSDPDDDGFAEKKELYFANLDRPTGLSWFNGQLYVAEPLRILALSDGDGDGRVDQTEVIVEGLPDDGGYWQRALHVSGDALYVSIPSRCNRCEEENPLRATIQRIDLPQRIMVPHARGLRYAATLTTDAASQLWATEIGPAKEGASVFPDEINRIDQGGDYGWPLCFGAWGDGEPLCRERIESTFDLPVAVAASGITSGHDLKAGNEYRNSLYVALSERGEGQGLQIVRMADVAGKSEKVVTPFIRGWRTKQGILGNPSSLHTTKAGGMFVSDGLNKAIYHIEFK